jgi:hypothetical protein
MHDEHLNPMAMRECARLGIGEPGDQLVGTATDAIGAV